MKNRDLCRGRVHVTTTSGAVKRISVCGKTRDEVRDRMGEPQARNSQGIPSPDTNAKLG
ncbi:hypothetical protein ACFU7Y_02160 [Kitasatospora sp. NPDC057542]|uniref:hypothetical protein n=1 Tax=Streptomycetaceae TaxID=2062 RepID=UPI001CCBABAF|nr:hypothetical protein [Streptomyces sp. LS1784]